MMIKKKSFDAGLYKFASNNNPINITFGYETYGKLNEAKDNAVMLCHFFTGTSHAAGRYAESDPAPGWWDSLIGPGKAIDTNIFFVISCDSISNINHHNPNVITTGPASINSQTGIPYGMDFPIFTIDDLVHLQKKLIDHLEISQLQHVIGPSMGGLTAFMWANLYPEITKKVLSVVATPMVRPACLMVPNQLGIESIMLDPKWNNGQYYDTKPPHDGLLLAFKILLTATRTDHWSHVNFGRKFAESELSKATNPYLSFDGKFLVEQEITNSVLQRMQFFDPNAYIYIAKANSLFTLCRNRENLADALARIKQPVHMIIDKSDLMFTVEQAEEARSMLPNCSLTYYNSNNGHLSGVFETEYLASSIKKFMNQEKMHEHEANNY